MGDSTSYTQKRGIVSDSIEVFESIDVTLLLVTVTLVLVLLLAIYRSPRRALVPLVPVVAQGAVAVRRDHVPEAAAHAPASADHRSV